MRGVAAAYETIVVDDASTDGTAAVARATGARVVSVGFRQIARTRNAGAAAAAGTTFVFVDADTIVPAATVRATLAALQRGVVGGGANVHFDGTLPLWARAFLPVVLTTLRVWRVASGCYVFCSRAAFEAVGGFDERYYAAEEVVFSRALRRIGTVAILRESVTTSGRKLRTHTIRDLVRLVASAARRGHAAVQSREALDLWYGERRHDA
jgi:glycosyltransferase involved in cell wall biosynthesis